MPNLLYAVYCATAGEGELPARKAGGVRGLLRQGGVPSEVSAGERERGDAGLGVGIGTTTATGMGKGAYGSLSRNHEQQTRKIVAEM